MEINISEVRIKISSLIDRVKEGDEVIILRRGKRVARLVPVQSRKKMLPDQKDFRASIQTAGESESSVIATQRNDERY